MAEKTRRCLRVVDLFAGIGGFRLGCEEAARRCGQDVETVLVCESDTAAAKVYRDNAERDGVREAIYHDDICTLVGNEVEDVDICCAGFPCQPFSLAGVSKRSSLGQVSGFALPGKGQMFDELARVLRVMRPKVLLAENVANLVTMDGGRLFAHIVNTLQDIGYVVHHKIIDASGWVAQRRRRVFIVGFLSPVAQTSCCEHFAFPEPPAARVPMSMVLETADVGRFMLTEKGLSCLQRHKERHAAKGNGFGFHVVSATDPDAVARTLTSCYHKGQASGSFVSDTSLERPRFLTPRECARLQGFPEHFVLAPNKTRAYMQLGNAVCVPVVADVATSILRTYLPQC